ncbi:MAG: ABC transporter permease [Thaumarchaeota archaeon]|nr:ABC transporter permease [Nitrososphaerota archaeon]
MRTIFKYEFRNYFRARRFYVLLAIDLLISALLTTVVGYYRPSIFLSSNLTFYSGWWGQFVTFVIILAGVFFGGDAISGEFQNKTGYFIIPNPIRRSSIYVGKWMAAYAASAITVGLFALGAVINGVFYFGASVPSQLWVSILFALLYLAAVMGFTFFFSSLFKTSSISILVTVILFLFVFSLVQTLVATLVGIEPWFILTYGGEIVGNILQVPYPVTNTIPGPGRFSLTTFAVSVPVGLAIISIYFFLTAAAGLFLFERKEFT